MLNTSMKIARERGKTFAGFQQSRYASGEYFSQYLQGDWQPKTDKVRSLFAASGITLPTREMWSQLRAQAAPGLPAMPFRTLPGRIWRWLAVENGVAADLAGLRAAGLEEPIRRHAEQGKCNVKMCDLNHIILSLFVKKTFL